MPIIESQDDTGPYYQFGATGKRYYYNPASTRSRKEALKKCKAQMRAVEASKGRKKGTR